MKGFFRWFKSATKMKRWIFVILVGIVLTCYSIAEIITIKELSFADVAKIIALFAIGFLAIIVGIVFSQKRILEILIEDTDSRIEKGKKDVNMKSLIFNKRVYDEGPNIVVIGGGTGLNTVLKGLKNYTSNLTGIVTVSSYGRELEDSNKALELLPIENIKRGIVSLANEEEIMNALFNVEFTSGRLEGLTFGDIYVSAMNRVSGGFSNSIKDVSKVLNITGRILPVTTEEVTICAELEDGTVIENKDKIPEVAQEKVSRISRIFLSPNYCKPAPGVIETIQNADAIIIGPGSLYTNVMPNLLIKGVAKAIKESKATKIYISNIMTEFGQTDDYSISDHLKAIEEHVGEGLIDYCIYDTGEIIPEYIKQYNKMGSDLVEQDVSKIKAKGVKMLQKRLSTIVEGSIRHDSEALAEAIIQIICDDLRFRDENADLIKIKTKLRNGKNKTKELKKQKNAQKKVLEKQRKQAGKHSGRKSKFQSKYNERIISIKTSDEKRQARIKSLEREEK